MQGCVREYENEVGCLRNVGEARRFDFTVLFFLRSEFYGMCAGNASGLLFHYERVSILCWDVDSH